jgi:hypothetical protein
MLRYAESLARHRPETGACTLAVSGGYAVFVGRSPFSSATGMAMEGAVSGAELDSVEHFFLSRGCDVRVEVCPAADASLLALLEARGYRLSEMTTVLYRRTVPANSYEPAPQEGAIRVRWAEASDGERWAEFLARCLYGPDADPELRRDLLAMFLVPDSLNCMAYLGGELAGVAGGMLAPRGGIASLYGGCTLPGARHRGLHAAMLRERLLRVGRAGCRMVLVGCTPGSAAERNLLRHGFCFAYNKQTCLKPRNL